MMHTLDYLKARFGLSSSEGATAVEYGIMVALIAIVIIIAVALLGESLKAVFYEVEASLSQNVS